MAGPTRDGPDGPLGDDDVQARWAEITEHLADLRDTTGTAPDGQGEAGHAGTAGDGAPAGGHDPASGSDRAPGTGAGTPQPPGPRDYAVEEDDEGFVPPDPAPPALTDPVVTLGWAAALGAAVALVVLPLLWRPLPGTVLTLLLAVLVAGAALLVWRMPRSRDGDRGGGAVV